MAGTQVAPTPTAPTPTAPAAGMPDTFRAFRDELDRMFDRFLGGFPGVSLPRFETLPRLPVPAVEVSETATDYRIAAELPGMSETDVEVGIADNTLTIKGEKRQATEKTDASTYLSERSYGAFERSFLLPEGVDRDRIDASFANGVLTVTLPKTAAAQQAARKIAVTAAG